MDAEEFWSRVNESVVAQPYVKIEAPSAAAPKSEKEQQAEKKVDRRTRRVLDAIAVIVWSYAIVKLFIFDVDNWFFELVGIDNYQRLKLILLLLFLLSCATFLRWRFFVGLVYVFFFPIIAATWKLGWFLYRRGSWVLFVGTASIVSLLLTSFRRKSISACLTLLSSIVLLSASSKPAIYSFASVLALVFIVALVRTLWSSLRPSEFLRVQDRLINLAVEKDLFGKTSWTGIELMRSDGQGIFQRTQLDRFAVELGNSIVLNKGLYFWAHQLDSYRRSTANLFFLGAQYVWLFLSSVATFTIINVGLLHANTHEFRFTEGVPSNARMLTYSMSSLMLNAGAGIEAGGSLAYATRIGAGFIGVVLLAGLVLSIASSARTKADDSHSTEVVETLRRRAAEQEERFREDFKVTVDEALERLQEIGAGLTILAKFFISRMPEHFDQRRSPER